MVNKDKVVGLLVGVAFGDAYALGWETEWPQPREEWELGAEILKPAGADEAPYSDDTEMTLILARHLAVSCGIVRSEFAEWLAYGANLYSPERGYGYTTTTVLSEVLACRSWEKVSPRVNSYGNGAAIRVAPVAAFFDSLDEVAKAAEYQAMVTHYHELGREGAVLMAMAQLLALEGVRGLELVEELLQVRRWGEVYEERLRRIPELIDASPQEVASALGNGVEAHRSVLTAIYCFVRFGDDPVKVTAAAICVGGDTDSIASMACSLAGANLGYSAFPEELVARIESVEEIVRVAGELYERSRKCGRKRIE